MQTVAKQLEGKYEASYFNWQPYRPVLEETASLHKRLSSFQQVQLQ
jgi:hypothetical protein